MVERTCAICGRPLPTRGGAGRASVYCSAACRQKAYRQRSSPDAAGVPELIADLGQRVQALRPHPPSLFYDGVSELAAGVGRLRRIAKVARDAAGDSVTRPSVTELPAAVTEPLTPVTESARADEAEFAAAVEPHRRELQVHCYRMVGSYDDAEDLVQETLLKAWRAREDVAGRSTLRAWLYRIATNVSLDFLRRNARRPLRYEPVPGMDHGGEPPDSYPWLQPFPDGPEAAAESRETLELVFLTALQHLPPQQRAVLMYRDVLDFSAADTAAHLDLSVAAVNSALQRARPALREHLPADRTTWRSSEISQPEKEILDQYVRIAATGDVDAMADLLAADAVLTMPPNPFWFVSRAAIIGFVRPTFDPDSPMYFGEWRHLATRANGRPAAAGYVRRPGTSVFRPQNLDVLRVVDGRIAEITTFEPHLFPAFGLPRTLRDE